MYGLNFPVVYQHRTHVWPSPSSRSRSRFSLSVKHLGTGCPEPYVASVSARLMTALIWSYCVVTLCCIKGWRGGVRVTERDAEDKRGRENDRKDWQKLWHVGRRRPSISWQLKRRGFAQLRMRMKQVGINLAGAIMQHGLIPETWNLFCATAELNNCCLTAEIWK